MPGEELARARSSARGRSASRPATPRTTSVTPTATETASPTPTAGKAPASAQRMKRPSRSGRRPLGAGEGVDHVGEELHGVQLRQRRRDGNAFIGAGSPRPSPPRPPPSRARRRRASVRQVWKLSARPQHRRAAGGSSLAPSAARPGRGMRAEPHLGRPRAGAGRRSASRSTLAVSPGVALVPAVDRAEPGPEPRARVGDRRPGRGVGRRIERPCVARAGEEQAPLVGKVRVDACGAARRRARPAC